MIGEFAKVIQSKLKSLQVLNLSFACSQNPDSRTLEQLALAIQQTSSTPHTLNLNFSSSNVSDDELLHLIEGIHSKSSKLRSLDLNLSSLKFSDNSIKFLADHLRQFEKMTDLNLNFKNCKLTDKASEKLAEAIKQHLESLTSLSLNFNWCGNLSEKTVCLLSNSLSGDSSSLRKLSLGFIGCKFSSNIFKDLARTIRDKSLDNLRDLQLSLPLLGLSNLGALAEAIKNHQETLQRIDLQFHSEISKSEQRVDPRGSKVTVWVTVQPKEEVQKIFAGIKNLELRWV